MARPDYDLNTARDGDMVSSNGTEYTINILWTGATDTTDMAFGPSGVEISYETPEDKSKNSYILTSTCKIPFLVQNDDDKAFILSLATDYQEREVWITVRKLPETTGDDVLLWCGYVILDLKDEQDVSYPYEVNLTAIDGLAALKEIPFIRETNTETGAVPTFPYITADTYYNAGFSNIIGGTTTFKWLAELIFKTGMVISDDGDGATFLENYTIQTAVNVYNEGHPTPAEDIDPLRYTKIDMQRLYSFATDNTITVPNCYQVLEYICKNFGMRCVYWNHTYHFVQINEYNTESVSDFSPINIPTRTYYYNGSAQGSQLYLGDADCAMYNLVLENVSAPGEGLQKLAGTIYSGIPALKTVNGTYFSNVGSNVYRGFPLFPTTWDTTGNEVYYSQYPYDSSGAKAWSTMIDAADADGINFEAYLSFKNTSTVSLGIRCLVYLIAKPSTTTAGPSVSDPWKVCARSLTAPFVYTWNDWTDGNPQPYSGGQALLRPGRTGFMAPPSPSIDQSVGIKAYSTAQDTFCTNGLFPVDAAFVGSWDFIPLTFTCYDSNSAKEMRGFDGTLGTEDFGASYSHGQVFTWSGTGTNYDGSALQQSQKIEEYKYDYDNAIDASGVTPFLGNLSLSVSGLAVPFSTNFEIDVVNKNTYIYDSLNYFWGDGQTIKVSSDGTTYDFASAVGKWTQPTYVWNNGTTQFDYTVGAYDKKLVELLLLNIVYNQSIPLKQLNGTTALSATDKYYYGTLLKYMNPIGKLTDLDNNQYQLMRGTFNLLNDQWDTTMNQVFYEVPSDTINVGEQEVVANSVTV